MTDRKGTDLINYETIPILLLLVVLERCFEKTEKILAFVVNDCEGDQDFKLSMRR